MHGIATLSYTNCQSGTKLILGQNVVGYCLIPATISGNTGETLYFIKPIFTAQHYTTPEKQALPDCNLA